MRHDPFEIIHSSEWTHQAWCDPKRLKRPPAEARGAAIVQVPVAAFLSMVGTVTRLSRKVNELSARLDTLEPKITSFESTTDDILQTVACRPDYFQVAEALPKVHRMTAEIFGVEPDRQEREDSEIPGDRHFSFRVTTFGRVSDILEWHHEWHRRLCELPPTIRHMFRLSVDVKQ